MGLAWTSMGGATLYVESVKFPAEKTEMKLTGQAGDVMKESSQIAWTYLHSKFDKYAPGAPSFFEKNQVHVHIPEGATPKHLKRKQRQIRPGDNSSFRITPLANEETI